ncbi:MAG TPA: HNH endonuclease [Actinomycetota bacterium]|jgi:putative restriction endonuclease
MSGADLDTRVRTQAFQFLTEQTRLHGEVVPRDLLERGFDFEGRRVPLIGPQGIFKPALLAEMPISITTVPVREGEARPYDDGVGPDGFLRYRYRGTDPGHRDNQGLRLAMGRGVPLIYLYGVTPGRYMPVWPVYIVRDHPAELSFSVAVDAPYMPVMSNFKPDPNSLEARRAYITVLTQQRLHQQGFRERVLRAYREQCAICRLRHDELLDAAHILPDSHPKGEPIVPNGLALCALHHAAFDRNILGIRPDFIVEVRMDILREKDGPMLLHGLQGFQGKTILRPSSRALWPRADFLAERYEEFRQAS